MTTALDTRAARDRRDWFYRLVRATARFWLWFFFKSVDVRHPERVPDAGPVLLCINHPNNFTDSLLVGAAVGRKVHYLATAGLFRRRLVARFLRACGAISVYRRQDDPRTCRRPPTVGAGLADPATTEKNADTFAACAAALAEGRVIAIYPEGTTHAEARVQRIKTGAARIALAYEAERRGELRLVPVGLAFDARKSFRRLEPERRARRIRLGWQAVVGLPLFAYGASVNFLPYWIPRWTARRMARKETDYATWRFLASVVAYPTFWGIEVWLVARVFGAAWALAFALSLPISGAVAYRYWVGAGRLTGRLRFNVLALTREHAARRLTAERQAILTELEHAKAEYLADTKGSPF